MHYWSSDKTFTSDYYFCWSDEDVTKKVRNFASMLQVARRYMDRIVPMVQRFNKKLKANSSSGKIQQQ